MLSEKERKIIKKIINRDEKAFFEFYQEHKKNLYHFISQQITNKEDAEEILQDSFFAFIESLRDFRGRSSLKTFLFSIAKHKIIDRLRKKKIKKILFSYLPERAIEGILSFVLDEDLDQKILAQKIEKVLEKLPNDYALVLRLKFQEGYKVAEIARIINSSFKATESLIFRSRKAFIKIYHHHERQNLSFLKKKASWHLFCLADWLSFSFFKSSIQI